MIERISPAGDQQAFQLYSPPFKMRPPKVGNIDLIPEDALRAMTVSWNRSDYKEQVVTGHLLNDVFVAAEGLVFDARGQLYIGSITQHSDIEIARAHDDVLSAIAGGLHPAEELFVLCKKRGVQNYGHWLLEMMPNAYFSHLCRGRAPRFIVPSAEGQLRQVIRESMQLLGVEDGQLAPVGGDVFRARELLLVEGLTNHGVFMSPLVFQSTGLISAQVRASGIRKIYVTRDGLLSRRFRNEEDIRARAVACGYQPIDPSTLSFPEQVAAFKGATDIVGVMGAGLTNIAFASRGARVTSLAPASMPDTFFWFVCGIRGLDYREVRCQQDGPIRGVAGWDTDMLLGSDDLNDVFTHQ